MLPLLTPALEAFVKLAEKIISTEKARREEKQQVFKEIIEPLFIQFQPVAEDFIEMFRQTKKRLIETPEDELFSIADELRALRNKMQFARHNTLRMASQMTTMYKDEIIIDFSKNIDRFLSAYEQPLGTPSRRTRSDEFSGLVMDVVSRKTDKSVLVEYIDNSIKSLVLIWNDIAQSYASAKIYYLSSPQLIKKSK